MQRLDRPITDDGFTILEMLIAMTITIIMLGVISRLFFDTTNAVSQGAALSQITGNTRAISDQLERDGLALVDAQQGGFIVIVNKVISNVPMKTRKDGETTRAVRADQLVFIREIDNIEHIAPGSTGSFAPNDPADLDAPFARVWYGHVRRTQPDGTDLPGNSGKLGNPASGNPNRVGTNWILGRQALMLSENSSNGASIFAATAQYNSPGTGLGGSPLFMGMTDICKQTLLQITDDLALAVNQADYRARAYNYAFITQRLRANPIPSGTTFETWRIGQMHPVFMENVSDFVVEFAADVTDDPNILINDPNIPGPDDGQIDINPTTGNVEWYGLGHVPAASNWTNNYPTSPGSPYAPFGANEVRWVFRHDYGDNWPYMIRIRYRLHDPNGRFEENIGDSATSETQSGKWFEQIFSVRKP